MTFEKGLYTAKVHATSGWKGILIKRPLLHLVFLSMLVGPATSSTIWAQGQGAALTSAAASSSPQAAGYRYAVPLSLALEAATEAVQVCAQHGYMVTATVVDMDGVRQVVIRGDGATIHTAESSYDKAYTVVTLGPIFDFDTSGAFFNLTKTNPFAPRLATMHNVMALPGGVAFKSKNAIVGALGVGGAPGGDKDEVCAQAGVAKVADRLPQ
ncbi:MAG: heme-binding protein [Bryobacteraceae bacterium]